MAELTNPIKLTTVDDLSSIVREAQRTGRITVFTNGCFDLMHPGHVQLLQTARQLGDMLIVGLNTDASVRRLKGPHRPIWTEYERVIMLAALGCVDYIILFDDDSPIPLLKALQPDILVKGAEYRHDQVMGYDVVEGYGGRIERIPMVQGLSTTDIVQRIIRAYQQETAVKDV